MFTTADVKRESNFVSSYGTFGINQYKIIGIDIKSSAPDKYRLYFKLETPPLEEEGFKPVEGSKGQVCNTQVWLNTEKTESGAKSIAEVMGIIGTIADKLGLGSEVDAIKEDTIEAYVTKFAAVVSGEKYAWYKLTGNEWAEGKVSLKFARFNFCHSLSEVNAEEAVKKVVRGREIIVELPVKGRKPMVWDENVEYDFKAYTEPTPTSDSMLNPREESIAKGDLPFDKPDNSEPSFLG